MTPRDLSRRQFEARLLRAGFEPRDYFGYWRLPIPGRHLCVSEYNGGDQLRDRLAYMLRELERAEGKETP